jgi:hypothetical protein
MKCTHSFLVPKVHTVLYDSLCLSLIACSFLCGPLILTQACLKKLAEAGANNEANFLTVQRLELIVKQCRKCSQLKQRAPLVRENFPEIFQTELWSLVVHWDTVPFKHDYQQCGHNREHLSIEPLACCV